jgi:CheY-like chemotaxis protein
MSNLKPQSPPSQSTSCTILLVEDEPILRAVLCQGLRQDGYTVLEAGHGKDALGICQQHTGPIHLLIADVVLPKKSELELKGSPSGVPELDGIEVARRVVALRPETRVIFISGHPKETWKPHRTGHPKGEFLLKPFDPDSLSRKVREVLEVPAR